MIRYEVILCVLCVVLSSCKSTGLKEIFQKNPPDEFLVVSNPPLILPPKYDIIENKKITDHAEKLAQNYPLNAAEKTFFRNMESYKIEDNIRVSFTDEQKNKSWILFNKKNDADVLDAKNEYNKFKKNK